MSNTIHVEDSLCRDCQACVLACSLEHEGSCSPALARLAIVKNMARYEFQILICRHCDPPECMLACPTDAMRMDEQGVVIIADEECDRCGLCADACPHNAIFHSRDQDRYLKCDLCAKWDEGPLCVALCPVGALTLVDVETVREEA